MKVAISSGHGLKVPGAAGIINEVTEARRVVKTVAQYLKLAGVTVAEFHDDTSTTQAANLNSIVRFHNAQTGDLDISVHFNACKKTEVSVGVEVLYYSEQVLAAKVSKAIAKAAGFKDRGAKPRTELYFLNGTKAPAILIEVCFVDSAADVKLYQQRFEDICRAIAEAASGKSVPDNQPELTKINSTVEALARLSKIGVIAAPAYWIEAVKSVNYLDILLINAANKCQEGKAGNALALDDAMDALTKAGVFQTPEYWRGAVRVVKYLETLIINIANQV